MTEVPYSPEVISVFRKFRQICEDISNCRFVRSLPSQSHVITIKNLPNGDSAIQCPQYDNDDFLAFLTHFRKLVAKKEPTSIFRVINLIAKHVSPAEREALGEIRAMLMSEAETPAIQIAIGIPGNETPYSPKQIESIIFNGQVFHSDDSLQDDLRKILDFDPFTKSSFLRYATILSRQAWQIAEVLKRRGYA